jgi:glycerophosphoryl diester phosphodiesterase
MIQSHASLDKPALVVGHRGARGLAPENTIAAFELGRNLGADIIELDVHVSNDGHVVVMHDSMVDRTTDGSGAIADMSVGEIKTLDAGSWFEARFAGERVPTLVETLEWSAGQVPLAIELKGGFELGLVEKVIERLWHYDMANNVILISFDHRALQHVKALSSEVRTGILYSARMVDTVAVARQAGADALHPNWHWVDAELIREAHVAGLSVSVWTVNEPEDMRALIDMGVDSIGTDYPDRLAIVLKERNQT